MPLRRAANPEDGGNIVIRGRNYRNDTHFGRLYEMETSVTVRLTDKYGEVYGYEIYGIQIIAPDGVSALKDYEGEHGLSPRPCTADAKNRLQVKCRITSELG